MVHTALSTGTLNFTTITGTNLYTSLSTITNSVFTNLSSSTISASTSTIPNIVATNISSSSFNGTNSTITNMVHTALSSGTFNVTTVTASSILATSNLNSSNLISTVATIPNSFFSNITSNTIVVTAGGLSSTFDTNTIGNIFTTGGNVGIGITNPNSTLSVSGGIVAVGSNSITTQGLYLQWNKTGNDGESWIINQRGLGLTSTASIRFGKSDTNNNITEQMRIADNGNVGIGTLSPNFNLDVSGSFNATTSITTAVLYSINQTTTNGVFTNLSSGTISLTTLSSANVHSSLGTFSNLVGVNLSSSNLISTVATIPNIIHTNITTTSIIVTGGGLLATFNSNTIGNLFTTGGNVGIGTTNPVASLNIQSAGIPLHVIQTNTSGNIIARLIGNGGAGNTYSLETGSYWNGTIGTARISFTDDGLFSSNMQFLLKQSGTENTTLIERVRITPSGNVGIGTTSPGTTLDVNGTGRISTSLTTASLFSTNITSTNAVFTNLSIGNLVGTTISTSNLYSSLGTISNLVGTNKSTKN